MSKGLVFVDIYVGLSLMNRLAEELAGDKLLPDKFSEGGIAEIRTQVCTHIIEYTIPKREIPPRFRV